MSSAPNAWPPPATAPANPAASLRWRIQHSWWLLLPIFGLSCLGGAGFLYVGLRARRPAWWIPGIVYTVVGWAAFIVGGEGGEKTAQENWGFGLAMAIWIGSIVHACVINGSWLRWRAGHVPWYAQSAAPPPTWPGAAYPPASAPPAFGSPSVPSSLPPAMAPQPGAYYGVGPVATPVPPVTAQSSGQPVAPQSPTPPVGPVDVNTATYEQLAVLPSFTPERAQRVLAERHARRGFGSVEEFAAAANLAPHEFAYVRKLLVCAPLQQPGPAGQWGQPPQGRVLDV